MATYKKQIGSSEADGQFYEINLVMLFLLRATEAKKKRQIDSFHLAANLDVAHPFDDVVFVYKSGDRCELILLQAKHKKNMKKNTIKWDTLFELNHKDLDVKKYLDGFVNMDLADVLQGLFDRKDMILYTNALLKKNDIKLPLETCDPNEFYRVEDKKVVKIEVGKLPLEAYEKIKVKKGTKGEYLSDEEIADFFNNFYLAHDHPNQTDLEMIIKKEIISFLKISQSEAEMIYNEVFHKVRNWWEEKNDVCFLTEQNDWFVTSRSKLTQPTLSYAMELLKNKLNDTGIRYKSTEELEECFKSNKIINVVCSTSTNILTCVQVYQMLEKCFSNSYYILLDEVSFNSMYEDVLKAFKGSCRLLAVSSSQPIPQELVQIVNEDSKQIIWIGPAQRGVSTISLKVSFSHLTDEVQNTIQIKLQGTVVPIVKLVDNSDEETIEDDLLVDLVTSEVVAVGRPLDGLGEVHSYHIPRRLKQKNSTKLYQPDEIQPDDGNKFILVSACPGMGKSTLVSSMMGEKFLWKYRINLIQHSKFLKTQPNMDALLFLKDATRMSDSEFRLFKVAYEKRGSIVLYLDGFDEIAPDYKLKVLQLFQSLRSSKVDEVWVTTRPGFEYELEKELRTAAFHLEPLSHDDQKMFFMKIWDNTNGDEVELLLTKISKATKNSGFTGIPLHLKMISEMRSEMATILELNLFILYDRFFYIKFYEVAKEGKLNLDLSIVELKVMVDEYYKIVWNNHEKLALLALYDKSDLLQIISTEDIEGIEKIMMEQVAEGKEKSGVVYSVSGDRPAFTHKTYAEFFAASWLKNFYVRNREENFVKMTIFRNIYSSENIALRTFFDFSLCEGSDACRAVLSKDYTKLEEMTRGDLLKKDSAGRIAYHLIKAYCYVDMEDNLRDKNADVYSLDDLFRYIPSQYAAIEMFKDMEYSQYRVYVSNEHGKDICKNLHWASANGDLDFIKKSIENGEDLNEKDDYNITPLHLAAAFGHVGIMQVLIENGALLNESDKMKSTPLHVAVMCGKLEAAKYLIQARAGLNEKDKYCRTPLHWVATLGDVGVTKMMMDYGVDVNVACDQGSTALYVAAKNGHTELVEMLLEQGADPNILSNDPSITCSIVGGPLNAAAEYGHADIARALLRHKANPHEMDLYSMTPLFMAATNGHDGVVRALIDFGADPNERSEEGDVALLMAAQHGHTRVAQTLLDYGSDPNVKDNVNRAPLFYAVKYGDVEMARILLGGGADPNLRIGPENISALQLAANHGHDEIVKMLKEYGANDIEDIEKGIEMVDIGTDQGVCGSVRTFYPRRLMNTFIP